MPQIVSELLSLWLPIVVCSIALHFASFILWAATPWHKPDIKTLPDQGAFDAAVKPLGLARGFYMAPCTHDPKEMKSEAFQKRYAEGPWMTVCVFPGRPNMGKNLALTLLTFFVATVLIAYLAAATLAPGASFGAVFRVTCVAGVLAYTFGGINNGVWFGKPTGWAVRDVIDAAIYACVTALTFSLLWPDAPTPAA